MDTPTLIVSNDPDAVRRMIAEQLEAARQRAVATADACDVGAVQDRPLNIKIDDHILVSVTGRQGEVIAYAAGKTMADAMAMARLIVGRVSIWSSPPAADAAPPPAA